MRHRILLVGWEAADWRILCPLIDSGRMPALQRLLKEGASGTLLCGRPLVPAVQWTSLVTGKRAWQHRVCHQFELDVTANRPAPIAAAGRKASALWEMLERHGKKSLIVGWPATHGAHSDLSDIVSNRYAEPTAGPGTKPWPPAIPGTYCPAELGPHLDPLRVSPQDIAADLISRLVPDWKKLDQKRDRRLGHLRVFLATDLSHHRALTHLISRDDWDFAAIHFPALGPISAMFLPFCPPRRAWVPEAEFQMYQQGLTATCNLLDRLLHSLLQAIGPDTALLLTSAHGVNPSLPPQYLRNPDNELWKTPYGILAASGPGFRPASLISGATIHDLAPTILTWFGLPLGDDMEGRVLLESFVTAPEVTRVPSWEPSTQAGGRLNQPASPGAPDNPVARRLSLQADWNLALSFLDAARFEQALPLLTQLVRAFPERSEFVQTLFHCQLTLKQTTEAAETLVLLLEAVPAGIWALLPRLELLLAQGNWREARLLSQEIQDLNPTQPEALRRWGMCLWRLRQWPALAELARKVLQRDENEPLAWLGLAEATLRLNQPAEAVEAARRSIALNFFQPQAHLLLARALLTQGLWDQAREAMQTALRLQPNNRAAETYSRRTGLAGPAGSTAS